VRRRATSLASGEGDEESALKARSDIGHSVWQGNRTGSRRPSVTSI
jgi:hypothetical protein